MGEKSCYSKVRETFTTKNIYAKILFAEFLGTMVLIAFGDASVAQNVLSRGASGQFISVNIAWGIAVAMGVWVSGGVSGGHINPAVTLAACIMGRCKWKRFPLYWIGQYLGAIAGAAIVYGMYYQAINDFDGGTRITNTTNPLATAGIFATYPLDYLDAWGGLGDQIVSTSLLMMCIAAITDENNMKPPKGMVPFCVGLIVTVIGLSMGHNCGYAINPARDLGPRIFTLMAGWGAEPFTWRNYNWFWVPVVGPHIGAILGGWMYVLFVGNHIWPDDDDEMSVTVIFDNEQDPRPDYDKSAGNRIALPRYHGELDVRPRNGVTNRGYSGDYSHQINSIEPQFSRHPSAKKSPYYAYEASHM